jgi:hypothetical protein
MVMLECQREKTETTGGFLSSKRKRKRKPKRERTRGAIHDLEMES